MTEDDNILATIRAANDRYAEAFAASDPDTLLALFKEDGGIVDGMAHPPRPDAQPRTGRHRRLTARQSPRGSRRGTVTPMLYPTTP